MKRFNLFNYCVLFCADLTDLVATCPNLTELDVSDGSALTGASFEAVCSLQSLQRLAISRCYNVSGVNLL